jgi:hypothetical protein
MSCFNNLFELEKKDLKKLIKSMDETIPVSKFNKKELLCLYFKILGLYREPIKKKNMWGNRHWNMYGDRQQINPLTNQQQFENELALEKYGYKTKKDFPPLEEDFIFSNIDEDYIPPPKNKPHKSGYKKRKIDEEINFPLEEIKEYTKTDYEADKRHFYSIYHAMGFRKANSEGNKTNYDKYLPRLYEALVKKGYIKKGHKPNHKNMEKILEKCLYENTFHNMKAEREKFVNFLRYKYGTTEKNPLPEIKEI